MGKLCKPFTQPFTKGGFMDEKAIYINDLLASIQVISQAALAEDEASKDLALAKIINLICEFDTNIQ